MEALNKIRVLSSRKKGGLCLVRVNILFLERVILIVFLFLVFDKYMTISGFQIEETIDRETSGNLEQLLLAVGR